MKTQGKTKKPAKRTAFGLELERAAQEILDHVQGKITLPVRRFVLPDDVDVKRIRAERGMSQSEFASAFAINPRTLQDWEQGRRRPDITARAYLSVIAKSPWHVLKALQG